MDTIQDGEGKRRRISPTRLFDQQRHKKISRFPATTPNLNSETAESPKPRSHPHRRGPTPFFPPPPRAPLPGGSAGHGGHGAEEAAGGRAGRQERPARGDQVPATAPPKKLESVLTGST